MDKEKEQNSLLVAGVAEVAIAAVLIIAILGTLNYFAILPLSNTFSFLSFLPQQSNQTKLSRGNQRQQTTKGSSQDQISQLTQLIVPSNAKTFTNSASEDKYNVIKGSEIRVMGPLKINVEMGIELASAVEKASGSSGLVFGNGLIQSPKDLGFIRLFYYPPGRNWALGYYHGDNSEFYNLLSMPTGEIYGKFSLLISENGRQVTVTLPTSENKTFNLPDSLYTATNQMSSTIQVAPGHTVTVSSLSYQY